LRILQPVHPVPIGELTAADPSPGNVEHGASGVR
jgi:hypothetical protein